MPKSITVPLTVTLGDAEPDTLVERAVAQYDPDLSVGRVLKAEKSDHYSLALAYPARRVDITKGMDGRRDFAEDDVIEKACWGFMAQGGVVGLMHRPGTEGHGIVVENYIYRNSSPWEITDARGDLVVIEKGDWLQGIVWDDPTWPFVENLIFNGLSPQGKGKRTKTPSEASLASLRS